MPGSNGTNRGFICGLRHQRITERICKYMG
jgi:hypothetical protein